MTLRLDASYSLYLRGCEQLGMPSLGFEEFVVGLERYERCRAVLYEYGLRRRDAAFWKGLGGPAGVVRVWRMLRAVKRERDRLRGIRDALAAGRETEGEGGAGVPAVPIFGPTLTGAAAKLPPHLDPEPDVREYAA